MTPVERIFLYTPPRSLAALARSAGCARGVRDVVVKVAKWDARAKRARRKIWVFGGIGT